MAATVGTLYMKGVKSGRPYTLSIYNASALAAGGYVQMDWNAPAVRTARTSGQSLSSSRLRISSRPQ